MKRIIALVAFAIACLTSCEPLPEDAFLRRFVIPEGEHYAKGRTVQFLQSRTLEFEARFDQSAVYTFDDQLYQDAKNKLMGFSDCNDNHHENSARFVWQWYNNQLEIWAYCYVNSVRVEQYIGTVALNTRNSYRITLTDDFYIFSLNNGEPVSIARGTTCNSGAYYMLWPYFGGTMPAPHDVTIDIWYKG